MGTSHITATTVRVAEGERDAVDDESGVTDTRCGFSTTLSTPLLDDRKDGVRFARVMNGQFSPNDVK
jgi:hypothetical protein